MEKETWLDDKGNKITEEYIIINKTTLEKRIERLEKQKDEYIFNPNKTNDYYRYNSMIKVLKEILFQSTPLISILEDAFDEGQTRSLGLTKQDYIANLKLDI